MTRTRKTVLRELGISRQIEPQEPRRAARHPITAELKSEILEMNTRGLSCIEMQRMLFRRHGWGGTAPSIRSALKRMLDTPSDSPLR